MRAAEPCPAPPAAVQVRIECYKVSLAPVKASIDEHMKKLQDTLVASLRRKVGGAGARAKGRSGPTRCRRRRGLWVGGSRRACAPLASSSPPPFPCPSCPLPPQTVAEKDQIEDFMKNGRELFTRQANTVEDIGLAGQEAKALTAKLGDVQEARRRIDEKNKLLRQMAGGGRDASFAVVDLTEVNNSWEAFTTQLTQFDAHLEEQKGQLAVQVRRGRRRRRRGAGALADVRGGASRRAAHRRVCLCPLSSPALHPLLLLLLARSRSGGSWRSSRAR